MRTYATAQLIGDRSHQCDATATYTHNGVRAYALLDGIGSTTAIRDWTRTAARRLAHAAAHNGDAEAGLRHLYNRYAAEPDRRNPWTDEPNACAVVAVHTGGKLTVAWCGDSRAYLLLGGELQRLTEDHNMRRVAPRWGSRNQVTSWLGSNATDRQLLQEVGHPAIESLTRDLPDGGRLLLASDGAYEPLEDSCRNLATYLTDSPATAARTFTQAAVDHASSHADNATALVADLPTMRPKESSMPEPVTFHRVIVRTPAEDMFPGWRMAVPPADAFDPAALRITPISQVRAGDTIVGTAQPHYDSQLDPLDRAQWVSYFSSAGWPQSQDVRLFDPQHCGHCGHEAYVRGIGYDSGHWTVDGCTTYRPDTLLLVVPRELGDPQ